MTSSRYGAQSLKHASRGVVIMLVIGLLGGTGTALAVEITGSRSAPHVVTRRGRHRRQTPSDAFAAFVRGKERTHAAVADAPANLPGRAVLMRAVGDTSVYMWERKKGEPIGPGWNRPAAEQMLCIAKATGGRVLSAGCGSAVTMARTGNIAFGQAGEQSTITITAVVPNGVESLKLIHGDGSSQEVKVTNNVVVVEASDLAQPPKPAVSYKLPDGRLYALPLPPGMGA